MTFPKFDPMLTILAIVAVWVIIAFYRAHRKPGFEFNMFDLVMENGRVSRIGVAFMTVLGVTTWVFIDLQITGKMTEGFMTTYGLMWVAPVVAKVFFNKTEPPGITTVETTTINKAVTVTEPVP